MSKDTYIHVLSFDLKMRNWPRHGALISIMSRKWIDTPRDDFPSLSFPLYVFTVLWHTLNLEIAPSKNATSLQWYRTVSALWAGLSSFWSFPHFIFSNFKGHTYHFVKGLVLNFLFKFQIFMILWTKVTEVLTYSPNFTSSVLGEGFTIVILLS